MAPNVWTHPYEAYCLTRELVEGLAELHHESTNVVLLGSQDFNVPLPNVPKPIHNKYIYIYIHIDVFCMV